MHKDVSLPAPAARSELNAGMEVKNQQSQQTISKNIEEKLNSACQILKKSSFCASRKPEPTRFFQHPISSEDQPIILDLTRLER